MVSVLVSLVALTNLSMAEGPLLFKQNLPKGISETTATKIMQLSSEKNKVIAAERLAAAKKRRDRVLEFVSSPQAAVKNVLTKRREWPKYSAEKQTILAAKLTTAERRAKLKELDAKYPGLVARCVIDAGIDLTAMNRALTSYLSQPTRLTQTMAVVLEDDAQTTVLPPATITLVPPYAESETATEAMALGNGATASVAVETGILDAKASAWGFIMDGSGEARVGQYFTIPEGYSKVKVTCRIKVLYDLDGDSQVVGDPAAGAYTTFYVFDGGQASGMDDWGVSVDFTLNSYQQITGTKVIDLGVSLVRSPGTVLFFQASACAYAYNGDLVGWCNSAVRAEVQKFMVQLEP